VTAPQADAIEPRHDGPLVSVVIPTHNRPDLVRRALASVVSQSYRGPIETIVVHDKEAPDPTLESGDRLRPVRAIENNHTPGLAGARNAGLAVARGEFIASLDDDDFWINGKVEAQVSVLLADPELLVVATGVVLHTADGQVRQRQAVGPLVTRRDLMRARIADLHSSNLMMRRGAFDLAGPYDEELVGVEDWEWLLRVSKHHPIRVVQEPLIHVFRDTPLWRPERWRRIANAHEQVLARHPDVEHDRDSAGYFYAKLAFAHAAGGNPGYACKLAVRALRKRAANPWAMVALLVAFRVPVKVIQDGANRLGRSI
jgi:glycosyltransferase involved in cell wall biosynthesis